MSKITSLVSLFLFVFNVCSEASGAQNISSGMIHVAVNITTPTCTSALTSNNLRLTCDNAGNTYSRQVFSANKKVNGLYGNIQSVNMQYINDTHTLGLLAVTYK